MATEAQVEAVVARLAAGEVRALARALSVVEDEGEGAAELLEACRARGKRARRIGVTGSAGVGKSTLIERMVRALRAAGGSVAVIAVDPSSSQTGGALLGDRIRMQGLSGDTGVFVRSVGTRGELGGLAKGVGGCVRC